MDELKPSFRGRVFNPFLKFRLNRRLAFLIAIFLGLVPWILFGFDSCIGQPLMMVRQVPQLLSGEITFAAWTQIWHDHYGKEMHYSAFLIYGLMYWALSRHLDCNFGIVKSKNVAYSAGLTLLSVALFEWYWILSYAHFQNQSWVATLRMPQFRIILQNILFIILGGLAVLYMYLDSFMLDKASKIIGRIYKFRVDKITLGLVALSVSLAALWWYYPFYVERIRVPLETGEVWTNANRFPQTLYTIDLNPTDSVNAGVWYFVENNWVHGLNTLVKVVWTLTIFYFGMVKRGEVYGTA